MDKYYTPPDVAQRLVAAASPPKRGTIIADFAAGTGELLLQAESRWPKREFLANDIDGAVIRSLRKRKPLWTLTNCNFLDDSSRRGSRPLVRAKERVGLCLLNPPFSYRGQETWPATLAGDDYRCSIALAFLLSVIDFIPKGAELLTILPAGTMHSEKDQRAWQAIDTHCQYRVVAENSVRAFKNCVVRTIVISLSRLATPLAKVTPLAKFTLSKQENRTVSLQRGNIRVKENLKLEPRAKTIPFVHTTDLQENTISLLNKTTIQKRSRFFGPGVILPRVGAPSHRKVALYLGEAPIALSDCVIGIGCGSSEDALAVYDTLLRHWSHVEASHGGTCARYITLATIKKLLAIFGFSSCADLSSLQANEVNAGSLNKVQATLAKHKAYDFASLPKFGVV